MCCMKCSLQQSWAGPRQETVLERHFQEFIYLFRFYLFIFREREKEREKNINVRQKHQLVASHMCPNWRPNLQPIHVPWLRIEPVNFYFVGQCPTNWAILAWAILKNLEGTVAEAMLIHAGMQRKADQIPVKNSSHKPVLGRAREASWVLTWEKRTGWVSEM